MALFFAIKTSAPWTQWTGVWVGILAAAVILFFRLAASADRDHDDRKAGRR